MKKLYIAGIAVLVLLAAFYFFVIRPAPATAAILYVENGTVEVDQGKGWQQGTDELELAEGDKVKTNDGEATIVFWEGEIMHLEPNTEVSLDDISKSDITVSQLAGETWNKVTRISGVKEYNVQTPTAVATVRGTEFFVTQDQLAVLDGEVDYGKDKKMKIRSGKKAKAFSLAEEELTPEELARYKKFTGKYEKILIKVRERELRKNRNFLKLAEKRGVNEDQLRQRLTDIDENRENEDDVYEQVPTMLKPRANRAYLLTKEIKRAKARNANGETTA